MRRYAAGSWYGPLSRPAWRVEYPRRCGPVGLPAWRCSFIACLAQERPVLKSADPSSRRHDPFAPFRQPGFTWYALCRLSTAGASTMLTAAIAWQVYQISGSALQLGLIGLARFLPVLCLSLPSGAVADSFNRRHVVLAAKSMLLVCAVVLFLVTSGGAANLLVIYGLVVAVAAAAAFEGPAMQALLPQIVDRETFPGAVTVTTTGQQLGFVVGPAIGGMLIATSGVAASYELTAALTLAALIAMYLVRLRTATGEKRAVSFAAMKEGVRFVRHRQVLLGAMTLDMFAVIFGGATALLPIYAEKILKVGAGGYGVLTSAQAIGAFAMSILLVFLPPVRRTGLMLLCAVAAFGLSTMLFGWSRSFPLSVFAYGLTGCADQVSVVLRQTTIQLATPDELRGRVSAIGSLFVGASNQVGQVESGLVAALIGTVFSVVSGGAGCIAVAGLVLTGMPELRAYRITYATLRQAIVSAPQPVIEQPAE
ncbi:MAG: MFS transporter [Dehalococcoidia bacterium]